MSRASFLRRLIHPARRPESKPVRRSRLAVAALEDRLTPSAPTTDWMSELPDSSSLAQLSIPGTHDTMTYGPVGDLVPYVKTQTASLDDQLNAGIRYLDIRVGPGGVAGDLGLYHGGLRLDVQTSTGVPRNMSFNWDVVRTCEAYLWAHPTETIVMSISNEATDSAGHNLLSSTDIDSVVDHLLDDKSPDKQFWYANDYEPGKVTKLSDVRKRIVLFDNYGGTDGISTWYPKDGGYSADARFYGTYAWQFDNVTTLKGVIDKKWDGVAATLNLAQDTPISGSTWFITNTNATIVEGSGSAQAGQFFDGVNAKSVADGGITSDGYLQGINDLLSTQTFSGRVGTVVMDYVRPSVIDKVIGANFNVWLSQTFVPKNATGGTSVGDFSTTTHNGGSSFTYSLVGGIGSGDNDTFTIDGNQLKTAAGVDLSAKPSYSIRVRSTDADGVSVEKVFTIRTADFILSNTVVPENLPTGTIVGQFDTTGPYGGSFKYDLVDAADYPDNAKFYVNYDSGILSTATPFDYAAKSSYSVRVRSTDVRSGLSVEKDFTINVATVVLSNTVVPKHLTEPIVLGVFNTIPANKYNTSYDYAFVSGAGSDDNAKFGMFPDHTGRLYTSDVNYDAQSSYSIRVRSTDSGSGLSVEKVFTINLSTIALSNDEVPENQPPGTFVGNFSTTGPADPYRYTFSYEFGGGTGAFYVDSNGVDSNGSLHTLAPLNYEAKSSYSIRVRSYRHDQQKAEEQLWDEKDFTIKVTDVNEAPTDIALTSTSIPENAPLYTVVGTFSTTDPDNNDTWRYSLPPGSVDNASFVLEGRTLRAAASFDYEAKPSYQILVRSTDSGGLTYDKLFTIDVANVNEAPTALTLSNATVVENAAGATVGTLTVTDPDAGDTQTFAVSDSRFEVVGVTLKLKGGVSLDFEAKPSYAILVRSIDSGGLTYDKLFTIDVANVNEAPTAIALGNDSFAENLPVGTVVGGFSNNDPDAGDTHTYSLVDDFAHSANNRLFSLDPDGTLRTARSFDFEIQNSYAILVRCTDAAGLSTDKEFVIRVIDVNEAPTDIAVSGNSVAENQPAGTVVGALSTTDPDRGDRFTYGLVGGDTTAFTIDGNQLKTAGSFDYEAKQSYSICVRSTDAGGLSYDKLFTINVTNVNEAPTVTGFTKVAAENNTLAFTARDFTDHYADPDGDALANVRIDSLPAGGLLKLNGVAVVAGQTISAANLNLLTFVPNHNFSGQVTFQYSASDGSLFAATPATVTLNIRSADQQAADLDLIVQALVRDGVLTSGQGEALSINLRDNHGDIGKVQAFLNQVRAYLAAGILNQTQADSLLEPGNIVLTSVTLR